MLSKELPYISKSSFKWSIVISMAIFLSFFLIIFLPFGVNNYNVHHKFTMVWLIHILGFSIITLIVSIINEFGLKRIIIRRNTISYLILWLIWSLILYGITNFYYYNYIGGWHDYTLVSALQFILMVTSVLIFPIAGVIFYFNYKTLRNQFDLYLKDSKLKIDPSQMITFQGESQSEILSISVDQFLFALSQDNYVEIYYKGTDKISRYLLRSTLKNLENSLSVNFIIRCHRSYVINVYQVVRIKGRSNDFQLSLRDVENVIPVSKTYAQIVLSNLKKYKKL